MKTVIIFGSSRTDGDTAQVVDKLIKHSEWDCVDLNKYDISYYDYQHKNRNDDYLSLMKNLIKRYDTLIFATPVYWYSMSGIMKVFIDRLTDLLEIEKPLGHKLRGMKMGVVSCSNGNNLGDIFWIPFIETAKYLGMKYLGGLHVINQEDSTEKLTQFIKRTNI